MSENSVNEYIVELKRQKESLASRFKKNIIILAVLDFLASVWAMFFLNIGSSELDISLFSKQINANQAGYEVIKNLYYSGFFKSVIAFLPSCIITVMILAVIYNHVIKLNKINDEINKFSN